MLSQAENLRRTTHGSGNPLAAARRPMRGLRLEIATSAAPQPSRNDSMGGFASSAIKQYNAQFSDLKRTDSG
jgi:hypothetical protein